MKPWSRTAALVGACALCCALTGCRELSNLRTINEQKDMRIAELQEELAKSREANFQLQSEKERESTSLRSRVDEMTAQMRMSDMSPSEREALLQQEIQQLKVQLAEASSEQDRADFERTNELEATRLENRDLQAKVAELRELLDQANAHVDTLVDERGAMEQQIAQMSQESQSASQRLATVDQEIGTRDQRIADLETALQEASSQIDQLTAGRQGLEQQLAESKAEQERLTQDFSAQAQRQQSQIAALETKLEETESSSAALTAARQQMETQIADLTAQLTQKSEELQTAQTALQEAAAERSAALETAQATIQQLEMERDASRTAYVQLEDQTTRQSDTLKQEITSLQTALETANRERQEALAEFERARLQLDTQTAEQRVALNQMEEEKNQIQARMDAQASLLNDQIRQLQSERDTIGSAQSEALARAEAESRQLKARVAEMEKQLAGVESSRQTESAQAMATINQLNQQIESMKSQSSQQSLSLDSALSATQAELRQLQARLTAMEAESLAPQAEPAATEEIAPRSDTAPEPRPALSPVQVEPIQPDFEQIHNDLKYVLADPIDKNQALVERADDRVTVVVWSNLIFESDDQISSRIEPFLKAVGDIIGREPDGVARIEAHSSQAGSGSLTLRQAQAVRRFLQNNSALTRANVEVEGEGDSSPRYTPGAPEELEGRNSRIEITLATE